MAEHLHRYRFLGDLDGSPVVWCVEVDCDANLNMSGVEDALDALGRLQPDLEALQSEVVELMRALRVVVDPRDPTVSDWIDGILARFEG